jgi:hypothetical protein
VMNASIEWLIGALSWLGVLGLSRPSSPRQLADFLRPRLIPNICRRYSIALIGERGWYDFLRLMKFYPRFMADLLFRRPRSASEPPTWDKANGA